VMPAGVDDQRATRGALSGVVFASRKAARFRGKTIASLRTAGRQLQAVEIEAESRDTGAVPAATPATNLNWVFVDARFGLVLQALICSKAPAWTSDPNRFHRVVAQVGRASRPLDNSCISVGADKTPSMAYDDQADSA
jgi:hypothetical protein